MMGILFTAATRHKQHGCEQNNNKSKQRCCVASHPFLHNIIWKNSVISIKNIQEKNSRTLLYQTTTQPAVFPAFLMTTNSLSFCKFSKHVDIASRNKFVISSFELSYLSPTKDL
jgi:hypothetical protein